MRQPPTALMFPKHIGRHGSKRRGYIARSCPDDVLHTEDRNRKGAHFLKPVPDGAPKSVDHQVQRALQRVPIRCRGVEQNPTYGTTCFTRLTRLEAFPNTRRRVTSPGGGSPACIDASQPFTGDMSTLCAWLGVYRTLTNASVTGVTGMIVVVRISFGRTHIGRQ